jgi:hypothetical protein
MAFIKSLACFVAIPATPEFEAVRRAVSEALNQHQIERVVLEDLPSQDWAPVTSDIVERADFVIADVTSESSDIFYQLGMADALRKPTLVMAQRQIKLQGDLARHQLLLYRVGEESKLTEYLRSWVGEVIERQRQRSAPASFA